MGDPRASWRAERGQTLPLFAIAFAAILGLAGLALDGARLYAEQERVQAAADAAAIGAAHELRRGNRDYSRSLLPAATHDAGLHGLTPEEAEVIVHHPPVSGAFAGSPDHVEVAVRVEMRTTFLGMFGRLSQTVSGRAVSGLVTSLQPCLIALASDGAGAVTVEGSQPLSIDCEVAVASSDPGAWSSGEACVEATAGLALAGGAVGSCVEGEVRPASGTLRDWVSGLRMPGCVGRSPGVADRADNGAVLYWPGCYQEPVEIRGGRARLMPGEHIFQQGLRIVGGEVAGEGVTLLFPAVAGQAGVELDEAASVTLSAPRSGSYAGLLMFAEAGGAVLERGSASTLTGALYFPGQTLRWAPNPPGPGPWVRAAADRIVILEGAGGRAISAPPEQTGGAALAALVE